jgi:TolB protein
MGVDGSNVHKLTQPGKGKSDVHPTWSPDGKRIAFHSNRDGSSEKLDYNELEIYVMDADGSNVKRLTFNDKFDAHPKW